MLAGRNWEASSDTGPQGPPKTELPEKHQVPGLHVVVVS